MGTNYWCKQCRTFVLDTPLGKKQHESSVKHQNNVSRTLRNLQRDKDRESKERAQVERTLSQIDRQLGTATTTSHPGHRNTKKSTSRDYAPPPLPAGPPPEAAGLPGAWTTVERVVQNINKSKDASPILIPANNKRRVDDTRTNSTGNQKKMKSTDSVSTRREARDEFHEWIPEEKGHEIEPQEPSKGGVKLPSKFSPKSNLEQDQPGDDSASTTPLFKKRLGPSKAKKRTGI